MHRLVLLIALAGCKDKVKQEPPPVPTPNERAEQMGFYLVMTGFVTDAASGNYDGAYGRTCKAYRAMVTATEFATVMKRNPYFQSGAKAESGGKVYGGTETSNAARVEVALTGPGGPAYSEMFFAKEDNTWCLSGVTVNGNPGLPQLAVPAASSATKR